jgi:hypothetical protein
MGQSNPTRSDMQFRTIGAVFGITFLLLTASASSWADTTTYSDAGSWNVAVPGSTHVNFDQGLGSQPYANFVPNGVTLDGVNFVDPSHNYLIFSNSVFYNNMPGANTLLFGCGVGETCSGGASQGIHVTLPTDVNAVSFNYLAYYRGNFVVRLADGEVFSAYNDGSNAFFGITSTQAIGSFDVNVTDKLYGYNQPEIGNFSYGTVAPVSVVPEPASLTMMAGGLSLLVSRLRKRTT